MTNLVAAPRFGTVYKLDVGKRQVSEMHIQNNFGAYRGTTVQALYDAADKADRAAGKTSFIMDTVILNGDFYVITGKDNTEFFNPGWRAVGSHFGEFDPVPAKKAALDLYLKFARPQVERLKPEAGVIPDVWYA